MFVVGAGRGECPDDSGGAHGLRAFCDGAAYDLGEAFGRTSDITRRSAGGRCPLLDGYSRITGGRDSYG
jgi:hypothetical protein